jgi:SAM-dependent methyltransferase
VITARSRAQEFGAVAQEYDRLRSAVPTAGLDWITPLRCRTAVELGAGTGLSTRRLARLAGSVLALEPDNKMRAVFPSGLDNVRLQAGTAESIPAASSSVDLVVAFDAWHWFEQPQTTYEAARVLRTGGTLGAAWNQPDISVDWVDRFWRAVSQTHDERRKPGRLLLATDTPFATPEYYIVHWHWHLEVEALVGLLGTYSAVLAMDPEDRARYLGEQRALVKRHAAVRPDGAVDVPFTTVCWRTRRLPGPARTPTT